MILASNIAFFSVPKINKTHKNYESSRCVRIRETFRTHYIRILWLYIRMLCIKQLKILEKLTD